MMYESDLNKTMLDVLENRMSGIADCIVALNEQGYIPNRNKYFILNASYALFNVFENIDLFNDTQIIALNNLYNKVIKL